MGTENTSCTATPKKTQSYKSLGEKYNAQEVREKCHHHERSNHNSRIIKGNADARPRHHQRPSLERKKKKQRPLEARGKM